MFASRADDGSPDREIARYVGGAVWLRYVSGSHESLHGRVPFVGQVAARCSGVLIATTGEECESPPEFLMSLLSLPA